MVDMVRCGIGDDIIEFIDSFGKSDTEKSRMERKSATIVILHCALIPTTYS